MLLSSCTFSRKNAYNSAAGRLCVHQPTFADVVTGDMGFTRSHRLIRRWQWRFEPRQPGDRTLVHLQYFISRKEDLGCPDQERDGEIDLLRVVQSHPLQLWFLCHGQVSAGVAVGTSQGLRTGPQGIAHCDLCLVGTSGG